MIHWLAALALISLGFAFPAWAFAKTSEAIVKRITRR